METILVIGGTGTLGEPVARQLRDDGYAVRLLVRDVARAHKQLGADFHYYQGDVDDTGSLEQALDGCNGVHISLKTSRPKDAERVEHQGTARVAAVAARLGVGRLTFVSGYLVGTGVQATVSDEAKLRAEQAIVASGVPFTIFKPTYFMETLPRHVQGRVAIVLGRQPHSFHMTAVQDFARMVSRAFRTPAAANRSLYVQGPQAHRIADALRIYCETVLPGTRVISVPLPVMSVIDRLFMHKALENTIELMRVMQQVGEVGDPSEANRLLGAPTTTLRAWCEQQSVLAVDPDLLVKTTARKGSASL